MKKESIVARKIIKDHILASSLEPHATLITNSMILSCKSARHKYKISLENVAASEKATEISNQAAILLSEIKLM